MDKYIGKKLDGRYEIRELIGIGGMACVYKAYDVVDGRDVAVKLLKEEFLNNEEFVRRFRNESKAIAILNHPNIVKVLDVGFGESMQFIVMEYIDGITLKEYLDQRKDIRWKEAVHFTVQILRALQHAHDKGIVHRDIKPQNIMLVSDGTIKVTDFGIARLSRNELRAATMDGEKAIGSVHYISPEQARGEITDEKADLYSVGVVLYEMLTGRLPFEADNAVSVAIMQMQTEPTAPHLINENVPEGLEQITMKAMQKDTAKRYQSAAEMLNDIDEFKRNPSIKFEYTYFSDETPTRYVDAITKIRGNGGAVQEPEEPREGEPKKLSTVAILSAVAAAVLLVTMVILGVVLFSGGKSEITVDNFVGMDYANEVTKMEGISKKYKIKMEEGYSADQPEGFVFKQEPEANTRIKTGGKLTLYVSKGSRLAQIPPLTPGENSGLVKSRLTAAGFTVNEVLESSLEIKKGCVIRLDPEAGEEAQYGSEITMYVSSGEPEEDPIAMPNVVGYSYNDAVETLVSAGFTRSHISANYVSDSSPADTVLGCTPDSSAKRVPSAEIVLKVSTGFLEVPISLELPSTATTVDLQFYVNGKQDEALTAKYKNIVPVDIGTLKFTVNEKSANYVVTVKISVAGKNDFAMYATYSANGKTGSATLREQYPFTEPAPEPTEPEPQGEEPEEPSFLPFRWPFG